MAGLQGVADAVVHLRTDSEASERLQLVLTQSSLPVEYESEG